MLFWKGELNLHQPWGWTGDARESAFKHLENLTGLCGKSEVEYMTILQCHWSSSCISVAAGRGGDSLT